MRLRFFAAGLLIAQSFGDIAIASSFDAYRCVLSLSRPEGDVKTTDYYMVLNSALGSGLDLNGGAAGEFGDTAINLYYGGGVIIARLHVIDTFQYPARYNIAMEILEINGSGERRELASSTFRRGDPNYDNISVKTADNTLKVDCNYLALNEKGTKNEKF